GHVITEGNFPVRTLAWALLARTGGALPPLLSAADPGVRAQYTGGTIAALAGKPSGGIDTTGADSLLFRSKAATVRIPYDRINTLEYGQRVSRRYAEAILISPLLVLAKKRKHYLTLGYTDEQGRQQALIFQVNKSEVRAVL